MGKYVTAGRSNMHGTEISHSVLTIVIYKCIVPSPPYMENGSLKSSQMDTRAQGGKPGSLSMCRSAWYRFMGPSILKKVFNFTI